MCVCVLILILYSQELWVVRLLFDQIHTRRASIHQVLTCFTDWYKSTCLLVLKYLLTSTKVQILTPEELRYIRC